MVNNGVPVTRLADIAISGAAAVDAGVELTAVSDITLPAAELLKVTVDAAAAAVDSFGGASSLTTMTSAAAVDDAVSAAAGFEAAAEVLLPAFEDFGGVTTIRGKGRRKEFLHDSAPERGVEVEVADEATDSASNSGMLMTGPSNGDSSRAGGVLLAGERSRGEDRPR